MTDSPFISICIPAYKRIEFLHRLFDSISIQTFKDYEIIITDDSPDESVKLLIQKYANLENVRYYRNQKTLGTPENWNEAIRRATGKWIKMMHDDDWFNEENALQLFYETAMKNPSFSFLFSAYNNVDEFSNLKTPVGLNWWGNFLLKQSPLNLFKKQFIGNPSCTFITRDINLYYDNEFKWVVDFEYYIRCLKKVKKYYYIREKLVNVGLNKDQVTKYSFRVAEVEIPENHLMIEKMGFHILRNVFVYDYYWRLYRNLEIRSLSDIQKYYDKPLHPFLRRMVNFQRKIPVGILKTRIFSKTFMFLNYLLSLFMKT